MMQNNPSRRRFLRENARLGGALTAGMLMSASVAEGQQPPKQPPQAKEKKPPIDAALVKEFVIAGHGKFEALKELLAKEPALLNAAWDWGGGDWETALGGAAHTGSREIALFLLEKGARMDLFTAAMLGKIEIVKAALAAFPGIEKVPGPHGISLLMHAKMGKEHAADVLKLLEGLTPPKKG